MSVSSYLINLMSVGGVCVFYVIKLVAEVAHITAVSLVYLYFIQQCVSLLREAQEVPQQHKTKKTVFPVFFFFYLEEDVRCIVHAHDQSTSS